MENLNIKKSLTALTGLTIVTAFLILMLNFSTPSLSRIIATTDLEVYTDANGTKPCTSIDWGTITPSVKKTFTIYAKNTGSAPVVLSLLTTNWQPSASQDFIELTWDYSSKPIRSGETRKINLILTVSQNVKDITSFTFTIEIMAVVEGIE